VRFADQETVRLILRNIVSTDGIRTDRDEIYSFKVMDGFRVGIRCEREKAESGCVPISDIMVEFSTPVEIKYRDGIYLTDDSGKKIYPVKRKIYEETEIMDLVTFEPPFYPDRTYILHIPEALVDIYNRRPVNSDKFPLRFKVDRMPPLVKFASQFGIVEMIDGEATLPLVVRGLKKDLKIKAHSIEGGIPESSQIEKEGLIIRLWNLLKRFFASIFSKEKMENEDRDRKNYLLTNIKMKSANLKDLMPEQIFRLINSVSYKDYSKSLFDVTGLHYEENQLPDISEFEDSTVIGIPFKRYGLYFLEAESSILGEYIIPKKSEEKDHIKKAYIHSVALVTDMAVTFKYGLKNSLVLVTRLGDGTPVNGAEIGLFDCTGKIYYTGKTNESGILFIDTELPSSDLLPQCKYNDEWDSFYFVNSGLIVTARYNNDFSLTNSNWKGGIEPFRYNIYSYNEFSYTSSPYVIHSVLSRNLLRAGERLHIKGYFREKRMKDIVLPPKRKMPRKIKITHTGTNKVWEEKIEWDKMGITFFQWDVPRDASTGYYQITYFDCPDDNTEYQCKYNSGSFTVEEFKVPLIKGELIVKENKSSSVVVEGIFNYLMGAPANDLQVALRYRFSDNFTYTNNKFENYRFALGRVKSGKISDISYMGESLYDESYEDEHGGSIESKFRWELINLKTDEYGRFTIEIPVKVLESGRPIILDLEAGYTDPDGYFHSISRSETIYTSPFITGVNVRTDSKNEGIKVSAVVLNRDNRPVKDVDVKLNLYEERGYSHRKKVIGGYYSYEYVKEVVPIKEICNGKTNSDGIFSCFRKIEEGNDYIVEVVAGDKNALSYSYVSTFIGYYDLDNWFSYHSDSDRTDIITNKESYKIGETAELKLITPFEKSLALVTIEREGILDYFITKLDSKRPTIRLPIKPEYAPNVYISVVLIRGRVKSPPPTFFVDLAKPSFKMAYKEINIDKERYRLDVIIKTEKEKYKVREKVNGSVEIRGAGNDEVDLALIVVDEGLLMLSENPTYDLLNNIIQNWDLQVNTSTGLVHVVGKRHFGKKALPSGGGGGRLVTRELFDTLLYFAKSLKVVNGKANFEFLLNDSITSFRIIAVAATKDKFGSGKKNIETTRDIFINSSIPYFAREGDSYDAEFLIKNISDREFNLESRITTIFKLKEKEIKRDSFRKDSIFIKKGGNEKISFRIDVPAAADEAIYNVEIFSQGKVVDNIKVKQKIVNAITNRVVQSIFQRFKHQYNEKNQSFSCENCRRRIGISFLRDLGEIGAILKDYRGFGLSCLEQKISYAIVADDREYYQKILNEINIYQDERGLFKYYPSSREGSPNLTAYILDITTLNGFELPENIKGRAIDGLEEFIMGRINCKNSYITTTYNIERIYALSAIRSDLKNAKDLLISLNPNISLLPLSSIIDVALIQGKSPELYNRIISSFTEKGGAYFINSNKNNNLWWLMRSEDEAFARAIIYLMSINADDTTLGKMVNGFLNRFERGYLYNTTANAYAAVALRLFSKRYRSDINESILSVGFNCNNYTEKIKNDFVNRTFIFDILKDNSVVGGDIFVDCLRNMEDTLYFEDGKNEYWVKILLEEEAPLTTPVFKGFKIKKEYLDNNGMPQKVFKQSDSVRVRITIEPDSYYKNFVVIDPLVTGSQVEGRIVKAPPDYIDYYWDYTYSDVRDGFIRVYYEYANSNKIVFEYSIRLNSKGTFTLPPTRVELMYMPDVYGEIPNEKIIIQ